jgi:hypothetical protein
MKRTTQLSTVQYITSTNSFPSIRRRVVVKLEKEVTARNMFPYSMMGMVRLVTEQWR